MFALVPCIYITSLQYNLLLGFHNILFDVLLAGVINIGNNIFLTPPPKINLALVETIVTKKEIIFIILQIALLDRLCIVVKIVEAAHINRR